VQINGDIPGTAAFLKKQSSVFLWLAMASKNEKDRDVG